MSAPDGPLSLRGQVAVVTGASGGLGVEIAKTLALHGARVIGLDLPPDAEEPWLEDLRARGAREAAYVRVDVSSAASVARAFSEVERRAGRVDILVNCAGIREIKQAVDLEPAEWDRVVAVNLSGTFYCAREATLRMRAAGRGAIVNVASVAGLVGITHRPAYTASKHGVVGLTKNLATDLAPMGVRVNAVAPGTIRTPLTNAYFGDESFLAGLKATVPLGAGGTPADVGNAVLFLASPMAAFITGVVLPVDGGWVAEKSYSPGATGGAYTSPAAGSMSSPDSDQM